MQRTGFDVTQITKIRALHRTYGLSAKTLASRFACSVSKIQNVLQGADDQPGDDIAYLQNKAPQQFRALIYIDLYFEKNGEMPSIHQITSHMKFISMRSTHALMNKLWNRNWLDKNPDTFDWRLAKRLPTEVTHGA